jgi:Relaxase/Mobilisation nuclease domain
MIIKSLSRKARGFRAGERGGGQSPFSALVRYMNRGIEAEDGKAVLWHNLYGHERMTEEELVAEFEKNAELLRVRVNGNVLYHEILSFSRGHALGDDALFRVVADIGQAYLDARAPNQLGYGVIHRNTDHIHLHLMVSANPVRRPERVRLAKSEFAEIQRRVERFALERYPELAQTRIYEREGAPERLKTEVHEQAMRARTGSASRKEALKVSLHQMFERASNTLELSKLMQAEGLSFYTRGRSVGVIEAAGQGVERRHRLATLGVLEHYERMNARLLGRPDIHKDKDMSKPQFPGYGGDAFARPDGAAEIVAEEFLTGELHPDWHPGKAEAPSAPYTDEVLKKAREREAELEAVRTRAREKNKDLERDR